MPAPETWYERHALPWLIDVACGLSPITRQRRLVVPQAAGDVLEIGIGTGRNLAHYDAARLRRLVGVDPAVAMHPRAQRRALRLGLPLELRVQAGERLELPSQSFDCVVCTYTLCSVQDPGAALAEMRRVLRPGGRLLFAEHGLAPDADVAAWQRRLEPVWSRLAGGCHLSRDVPRLLREAHFAARTETAYVAWPRALAYTYWGSASVA